MRRHHCGSRAVPASTGCPAAFGDPTQPRCWAGIHPGLRGAAVVLHVQRHVAAVQAWHWIVVVAGRSGGLGARGRVNALISVIETRSGSAATLSTAPAVESAVELRQRLQEPSAGARSRACTTPILAASHLHASPLPPPARAAAGVDGHDQDRQGSPTRCRCWAARLAAALRRSRPRRPLRCWRGLPATRPRPLPRPGRPPPPPAARLPG